MKNEIPVTAICLCLLLCGCSSVEKRQLKNASVGIYAVQSALNEGRVDLAKKYADEAVKILPAPKKKDSIKVKAIIAPPLTEDPAELPRKLTILPDEYQKFLDEGLIFTNAEIKRVAAVEPEIAKQIEAEEKQLESYKEDVEKTRGHIFDRAAEKPKAKIPWMFVIPAAAIITACFVNPALIPLIIGKIVSLFKALLDSIGKLFK
jgi:hypothetical protein